MPCSNLRGDRPTLPPIYRRKGLAQGQFHTSIRSMVVKKEEKLKVLECYLAVAEAHVASLTRAGNLSYASVVYHRDVKPLVVAIAKGK